MTLRKPARILIVDDHPLLREALTLTISSHADLEVCAQANDEYEAFSLVRELEPDLVLIDISLENGNGIELVKQINHGIPRTKMLVISAYPESLYAERVLRSGASGYVNKQESKETIIAAIRVILGGDRYLSPTMTQRLVDQALTGTQKTVSPVETLSDRELQVFQLIGRGLAGIEVAEKLGVSVNTVDSYRANLKTKLGLSNGVQLQHQAIRWVMENE